MSVGSGRGTFLQPAVAENAIYAAAGSGIVMRVDPASGSVVRCTDVGSSISAGVGPHGFSVAVASPRGEVVTLDADGKERCQEITFYL